MSASDVISTVLGGPAMGIPLPSSAPAGLKGAVGVLQDAIKAGGGLTAKIASTATVVKAVYDLGSFAYGYYTCP